jgi:hypothetical protein
MYILLNIAIMNHPGDAWAPWSPDLSFPASMFVDWVRVYQDPEEINVGCNPPDYPTNDIISCNLDR